jgi:hypothetical protein
VHPDARHTEVNAFLYNLLAYFGVGEDENTIRFLGDGFEIGVAWVTFKSAQTWVDRTDLLTGTLEFSIGQVTTGLTFIGYTDDCNALLR